jgi:hypothetical protein
MDGQYSPDDEIDIDSLASSEPPEYVPQMFSEGGEVEEDDIEYYAKGGDASIESQTDSMNQFLLADEADTAYAPMYPSEAKESEKDTRTAKMMLKQLSTKGGGGKSKRSKEMSMEMAGLSPAIPELGASPTEQEKLMQIASARSQYDALEQAYKLKAQAAQRAGKGFMRPTFNAASLESPTLEKPGPLMARTFAKGGAALKGTKAVDEAGKPVLAYRGEYGPGSGLSTQQGSLSYGTKDAANLYATSPNTGAAVEAAKVFPSYLSIRKPLVNDPTDPFIDLGVLRKALGEAEFSRVVKNNSGLIERTGAFDRLATERGYTSVADVMKKDPKALNSLYVDIYPILDDAQAVKTLQKRGYDGAIYGGSGATAREPEYRVFGASQAVSPYGMQPMAPRTARQQFSDVVRSMDISPTDALEFLGKAGGAAATALSPSTTNEGEAEELARRRAMPPTITPVKRAEGSPASGERLTPQQIERLAADQAALNQYYAAKARPSTGMNRQKGPISQQLDTGEAYINMAKGVTELPYDLAGAPVDIATLLMRPFGYSTEKPVMGSDWIKAQMTKAGVRPEPPADPTAKGFYTAGELLSNLTNPAAVPRKVGPVVEKGVTAVGKEAARQVERGMFNEGPLRNITPQPMYAVRPEGGGTTFTGVREPASSRTTAPISRFDKLIEAGANPRIEGLSNEMGDAIENFWRSKAQNYFTRQYGTPSDPVFKQIISGQLRTPALQRQIPDYALDQLSVGKTRVDPVTGESRFYPKYPQALEDLTRRYDEMTGLEGVAFNVKEPIFDPNYPSTMGNRGTQLEIAAREDVINKLIAGGMNPNLINPKVTLTGPRSDAPDALLNYVPGEYKELYSMYANPPKDQSMIDRIYKELGLTEDVKPGVPENIKRAIETSEPIYDINFSYRSPLKDLLTPENINRYLATKTPAEINKMRFEDVVKNSAKYNLDMFNTQNLVDAIRSGKRVPEKVWTQGISEPLMTLGEGQNKFTWHRIVDNEATAVEGAYLGHSVGGYAKGGSYGPAEYRRFQEGQKQVFTLRDSKGKPFTTVEVEKVQTGPLGKELSPRELARAKAEGRELELGPVMTVVRQIKGNGGKTGNTAPKDAEDQVMTFIKDYIRPDKITESDTFLTPKLEELKMDLSGRPRP